MPGTLELLKPFVNGFNWQTNSRVPVGLGGVSDLIANFYNFIPLWTAHTHEKNKVFLILTKYKYHGS